MVEHVNFKNFRRFEEFPAMELGQINFFVGRNNAGKSTVLKALQLIKGNLNTLSNLTQRDGSITSSQPMFVFDAEEMADLHIDNFERALYNQAKRKEITLSATFNGCSFTMILDGQNVIQNGYYVAVPYQYIEIFDKSTKISFIPQGRELSLSLDQTSAIDNVQMVIKQNELSLAATRIQNTNKQLEEINQRLQGGDVTGTELIQLVDTKQSLEKNLKLIKKNKEEIEGELESLTSAEKVEFTLKNVPEVSDAQEYNIIEQIFQTIYHYATLKPEIDGRTAEAKEFKGIQQQIVGITEILKEKESNFIKSLTNYRLEYIHAHAASQKVIYLKNDKTDALSCALHEYCKAGIMSNDKEARFVTKWMGEKWFNIGDEYIIEGVQSAGYTLQIVENQERLNLADKGTGSIQIMTLLLSLAVIMRKAAYHGVCPTILIEEPEQNIHPMLQSMLADMLQDFWNIMQSQSGAQIIVETHSEYLVRRTQIIVAQRQYVNETEMEEDNPFRVFYFDKANADTPFYRMRYNTNGRFIESFGAGFYDAAGQLSMDLSDSSSEEEEDLQFNWDSLK